MVWGLEICEHLGLGPEPGFRVRAFNLWVPGHVRDCRSPSSGLCRRHIGNQDYEYVLLLWVSVAKG